MKIHDGLCTGKPCSRTHAYKCRACKTWFKQDLTEMGGASLRPHPFYPYCSHSCAVIARRSDAGFHLFAAYVNIAIGSDVMKNQYIDALSHADFNELMTETKEMA